jgi:hypothetical protein
MLEIFLMLTFCFSNPFEIEAPNTTNPTVEDYKNAQAALRKIEIGNLIKNLYPADWEKEIAKSSKYFYKKEDFILRCSKALSQNLFLYNPKTIFSEGTDKKNCVVGYCSYNGPLSNLLEELEIALREVGFCGGIYYRTGGYPTPRGDELKFAGVPYAFKLFMIEEAFKLGYEQVLWLDSAVWPLSSIDDLFQDIKNEGFLFDWGKPNLYGILPVAKKALEEYLGRDFIKERKIAGWIMGMSSLDPRTKDILKDYRVLVEMGIPFLSVNPEEYVITNILLKHGVETRARKNFMITCTKNNSTYVDAIKKGCKFIIRVH